MRRESAADSPLWAIVKARASMQKDSNARALIKMAFGDQTHSRDCLERSLIFIARFFEEEGSVKETFISDFDCITKKMIAN